MAVNTKQALLAALGKGPAMFNWGAIMALGRDMLNAQLEARFLERLSRLDFVSPITGVYYVDGMNTEQVKFEKLQFGPPSLSFEHASGQTSRVRVHMELIAGRCESNSMFPGEPKYLRNSHLLSPGLGYRLEFTTQLVVVPVETSGGSQLQVAVDLATATEPSCNLAQGAEARMGRIMLDQLLEQPGFAQAFAFLTIAPVTKDVCSVVEVVPITQRAPDGAGTGSLPEADGAVLLCMRLQGSATNGLVPAELPYLLPRKVDSVAENTDVAVLLGRIRSKIRETPISRLLSQLIFPSGDTIAITDEHNPHDQIGFGEFKTSASMAWLSPGLSSIAAGERVTFNSNNVQMHDWQARDLTEPRSAGAISQQGVYDSRLIEEAGSAQRVTLVTAKTSQQVDAQTRAALVIESQEPLTISPRVATWYRDRGDVRLRASGGSRLTWKLLGEKMGVIEPDPEDARQATFKPTAQATPFARLQRIEVSDGKNTGHATVALFGVNHRLDVEPYPLPRISPGASLSFSLPDAEVDEWRLVGPGNIEPGTGKYTAPAQTNDEVSVVVAVAGRLYGVAVIEHQTPAPAQALALTERWKELEEFTLRRNNLNRNQVFANGLAQVGIDIVIRTMSFTDSNGEVVWDPVSDLELSTLVLTDANGSVIPYLKEGETGIPEGSPVTWMASKRRNDMYAYYPVGELDEEERLAGEADGRRVVTIYVHCREAETIWIRAKFQDHNRGWRESQDVDLQNGEIQLDGIRVPESSLENFNWGTTGKRVASKDGEDYEGDRFNYWHSTTDYWYLSGRGIKFVDVKFESSSMIKWESEQLDETFASYTGFAFKPLRAEEAPAIPPGVNYQAEMELLSKEEAVNFSGLDYAFKGQEEVSAGEILITLDRTSSMLFWDDYAGTNYREVLKESMKFTVIDNYGNVHKLRLLFSGESDPRNYLELRLQ